jgi:hypothetical protein
MVVSHLLFKVSAAILGIMDNNVREYEKWMLKAGQSNLINDSIEWEKQKMMKNEKQTEGRKMERIA